MSEACAPFACFGARCTVIVEGPGAEGLAAAARDLLLAWHERFTRFDPASELSRLNADMRAAVPVTPLMGRLGGAPRTVRVESPFGGGVVHELTVDGGGVATSGIGRRTWPSADRSPAHHLLDPGTGRPAFTGVVQATALAPTALEAEVRAQAAVLSGPDGAGAWLPHGGVVVLDDGNYLTS